MTDFIAKSLSSILENKQNKAKTLVGKVFDPVAKPKDNGILIFGMNPAGDAKTAKAEQNPNYFYLNYIIDSPKGKIKETTNNTYFKPIYNSLSKITNYNIKWDWCNLNWQDIEINLKNNRFTQNEIQQVKDFYNIHKKKEYTIYIGDAWYIHMTKQPDFEQLIDESKKNQHIKDMLDLHIDEISKYSELKAIYVNNGKLSHWISDIFNINPFVSVCRYKNIPILFGSMLSGQRAMDAFSKIRLENEFKDILNIKGAKMDKDLIVKNSLRELLLNIYNQYRKEYGENTACNELAEIIAVVIKPQLKTANTIDKDFQIMKEFAKQEVQNVYNYMLNYNDERNVKKFFGAMFSDITGKKK